MPKKVIFFWIFFSNSCDIELFLCIICMHNLSALYAQYYVFQCTILCLCMHNIMSFNQMCVVVNFHYFFICFEWAKLFCFNATLPTMISSGFFPIKCYQWAILALCMISLPSLSVFKKRNCQHLIHKVGINAL